MLIGRSILTDSILTQLMLGTPQVANITMAVTTNFPLPGKGIAAPSRQTNRQGTILSFDDSGQPFGQINNPRYFSCFFRPTAFA